jgi:hypothetical protein
MNIKSNGKSQARGTFAKRILELLIAWVLSVAYCSSAGNLQLVSTPIPGTPAHADGNGYTDIPIISADGRYVLFASTSINLVSNPFASSFSLPASWSSQVFIRVRLAGATALVSANLSGLPGNGDSVPEAISTNGQFVLFESFASDLVAGDNNNQPDIFLRDLVNQVTILVSVNTNGVPGNGASQNAVMSPDARYLAFSSASTDLVPSDTNGIPDIFVRDRIAGTTILASAGAMSAGSILLPGTSDSPQITPDGRYVSFYSLATNLVPGQVVPGQIFVRDLVGGQTIWASTNVQSLFSSIYGSTNELSFNQLISTDGNYVVFEAFTNSVSSTTYNPRGVLLRYHLQSGITDLISTNATVPVLPFNDQNDNLDITPDGRFVAFICATNLGTAWTPCVELWDGQSGATTLISQPLNGTFTTNGDFAWPRLNSTGRYVAFISSATNLVTNANSGYNCYLFDTQAGVTTLVNVDTNENGTGYTFLAPPSICSDGHLVAFACADGDILPNPNNNPYVSDVFVRDNNANTTEMDSLCGPNLADTSTGFSSGCAAVSLSSNGLFIAFTSEGSLVAADTNNLRDVYLRDVANQTNILVSVDTNGVAGSGLSSEPSVDASGRYVVFSSSAPDLAPGANNGISDIYLRDMLAGTTQLISQNETNTGDGNGPSYTPTLSTDARYVLFYSQANNLAAGISGNVNLFLRDLQQNTNYALTTSGFAGAAAMTSNGHRVAYFNSNLQDVFVWDTATAQCIYTNHLTGTFSLYPVVPAISPDGNFVVYCATQLTVVSLVSNTVISLGAGIPASYIGAHFSSDGRFLTYAFNATNALNTNTSAEIYLYDFQTGTDILISQAYNSSLAANGPADSPVISPDGRFIAFRSLASNNVPNDFNVVPDLMLYDRSNAVTLAITASDYGNHTAANRSLNPVFSGDGKTLAFSSWASDLVPQDFNPGSDVFMLSLAGAYSGGYTNNNGNATNTISGLQMTQPPSPNSPPAFTWPAQPGAFYQLQYKNNLTDPAWQNFYGSVSIIGTIGSAYDLNPASGSRFYRVLTAN